MTELGCPKRVDVVAFAVGALALLAVGLHAPVPLRVLLTFGFCGICPGLAAISGFAPKERLERIVIAIGLSAAIDTVVTELMAMRHLDTALGALIVLTTLIATKIAFGVFGVTPRLVAWSGAVAPRLTARDDPTRALAPLVADAHRTRRSRPSHDRPGRG